MKSKRQYTYILSLSSDFTDIEYGENKRDNLQWPYRNNKNRPFLELPHHRMSLKPRNTPRDSWNGDNKKPPIAKPLIRTRSLSAGNLVSYPPLPSAPFYNSPPTSEDDTTLPIRNQSPHAPRCGPGVAVIKNGWDDKDI
uniref:Uncharacterized protein n=1 Tax=Heterorhabditis bacteriophora TaxID=37862 RepID=A0A1I7XH17_HETBA